MDLRKVNIRHHNRSRDVLPEIISNIYRAIAKCPDVSGFAQVVDLFQYSVTLRGQFRYHCVLEKAPSEVSFIPRHFPFLHCLKHCACYYLLLFLSSLKKVNLLELSVTQSNAPRMPQVCHH